ncbi:MAG: GNAT family N-acetyltransferase [Kiloniellales bacterium]
MSTVRRPLTAFDLPVLEHLHADSFPEDPWSARSFGELLALPGVSGLLTQAPEEPVGFLLWRRAADEAEVLTLCVQSAARRRGLAASMLRVAMASLKRSGTQRLFLEVAEDNAAARELYRSLRFCEVGRRLGYYRRSGRPKIDALLLEISLKGD